MHSRTLFPLHDPKPSDVLFDDISHSLARICRYTGHTDRHYSVAEHSLLVARRVLRMTGDLEKAYAGLMHDAAEAYVGDICRPLKNTSPDLEKALDAVENRVWGAITLKFGFPYNLPKEIHEADDFLYRVEYSVLFQREDQHPDLPIQCARPDLAEAAFRRMHSELRQYLGLPEIA